MTRGGRRVGRSGSGRDLEGAGRRPRLASGGTRGCGGGSDVQREGASLARRPHRAARTPRGGSGDDARSPVRVTSRAPAGGLHRGRGHRYGLRGLLGLPDRGAFLLWGGWGCSPVFPSWSVPTPTTAAAGDKGADGRVARLEPGARPPHAGNSGHPVLLPPLRLRDGRLRRPVPRRSGRGDPQILLQALFPKRPSNLQPVCQHLRPHNTTKKSGLVIDCGVYRRMVDLW
jgi:hypothetical protein